MYLKTQPVVSSSAWFLTQVLCVPLTLQPRPCTHTPNRPQEEALQKEAQPIEDYIHIQGQVTPTNDSHKAAYRAPSCPTAPRIPIAG